MKTILALAIALLLTASALNAQTVEKPKSVWRACLYSTAVPGLGQAYNGDYKTAFIFEGAIVASLYASSKFEDKQTRHNFYYLAGWIHVWNILNAGVRAHEHNKRLAFVPLITPKSKGLAFSVRF